LGGKLFIIYGMLLMLSAFLKDMALWLFVMISGTVILLVILTVYSYLIWKTDPHRQGNSSGTVSSGSGILPILFAITLGMILLFAGIYAYLFRSTISTIEMNHRAQQVVISMGKGDFETAETHFDSKMLKGLPPAKLKNVWGSLVAEEGPYQKINNTRVQRLFPLPFTIIHVNTQLKNSSMDIKVVFSRSGKISGLWVSPVQS
jgi:hypothetical protein